MLEGLFLFSIHPVKKLQKSIKNAVECSYCCYIKRYTVVLLLYLLFLKAIDREYEELFCSQLVPCIRNIIMTSLRAISTSILNPETADVFN